MEDTMILWGHPMPVSALQPNPINGFVHYTYAKFIDPHYDGIQIWMY